MRKIISLTGFLSVSVLMLLPAVLQAQDTKKEVHIKIVENGKVIRDTAYTVTGDLPETDELPGVPHHCQGMPPDHRMMEMHMKMSGDSMDCAKMKPENCGEMQHMRMREMHRVVMIDSMHTEGTEGGMQKEYTVRVINDGDIENSDVEEIWLDGQEGRPCRTIIIHEGDCPEGQVEKNVEVIIKDGPGGMDTPPPPPPPPGEKPANVNRKVVKTDGGKKVMIIETEDDSKGKDKK